MNGILRIAVAIGICIILYILAGCGPGEEMGTIVFTSNRNGNAEIYSMRADGKKQKRLTKNECSDEAPWWSPDRSRLVFTSDRTGNWDIFVMNADGTSPVQLTNSEKDDRFPCWSPDGKKILFQSNQEGRYELYIMNPDGTDLRRIKIREEVPPPGKKKVLKAPIKKDISKEIKPEYTHPVWFPNCSSLIYMKESKTGASLWKTGMDGKKPEQLTRTKKWDMCPSVAPDGSRILFSSNESDE
ncbi:MAG: hypothetical protein EHM79_20330, partial [Geobacter sp.]